MHSNYFIKKYFKNLKLTELYSLMKLFSNNG